jgi:hypothetical protein
LYRNLVLKCSFMPYNIVIYLIFYNLPLLIFSVPILYNSAVRGGCCADACKDHRGGRLGDLY